MLRILFGLIAGFAGGAAFWALSLPLPWMLGALFASMAAAVGGAPVAAPNRARPAVVAVIGVLLGARFTPEVLGQMAGWWVTVAILCVYLVAVGLVVVPFYRFAGRQDWTTAFFAGMPGGLTEMIEIGEARGADVRAIILAHSLRIVVTIAMVAFWFQLVMGVSPGADGTGGAPAIPPLTDAVVMIVAAVAGSLIGRALRFPAPTFLGPLAVSGLLHLTGLSQSVPPDWLVAGAQVVLGTILGCRFIGMRAGELVRAGGLSVVSTALTLGLALVAGLAMRSLAGVGLDQSILALAPGGLTEMGLIALAIQADVAFVALHHVVRILLVIVVAPPLYARLARRS